MPSSTLVLFFPYVGVRFSSRKPTSFLGGFIGPGVLNHRSNTLLNPQRLLRAMLVQQARPYNNDGSCLLANVCHTFWEGVRTLGHSFTSPAGLKRITCNPLPLMLDSPAYALKSHTPKYSYIIEHAGGYLILGSRGVLLLGGGDYEHFFREWKKGSREELRMLGTQQMNWERACLGFRVWGLGFRV